MLLFRVNGCVCILYLAMYTEYAASLADHMHKCTLSLHACLVNVRLCVHEELAMCMV